MKWVLKKIKVSDLKENPRNPRNLTEKGLKDLENSIKKFGLAEPLVVNTDLMICGGHGRKKILEKLNIESVDCYLPEKKLTQKQFDELGIRLNKNIAGEFNFDILANEFEVDELIEWGFEEKELDLNLWNEISDEKLDEVPEIPKKAISKLGDLFLIDGKHRVMCGDSTKADDVEKLMDGKKADMVFTDPPYGNGKSGKYGRGQLGIRTIQNDDNFETVNNFISLNLFTAYIFFLQWRTFKELFLTLDNNNLKLNTIGVWDKKNAGLSGAGGIAEQWEAILFAGDLKYSKFGGNVFTVSREQKKREDSPHPHQKPIELLIQILDFVKDYKLIFDSFLGSGSTLIACEQTKRICYGMELDPIYIDVILKRYKKLYPEAKFECLNSKFDFDKLFTDD